MTKIIKGKNYSLFLTNRRKSLNGIILSKNDNIISKINNPVDFVIDGIVFINNQKVKEIVLGVNEINEKKINSKFHHILKNNDEYFNKNFKNFKSLFSELKKRNIFCQLSLGKEDVIYIGEIINVNEDSIDIDFFDTKFELIDNAFVKYEDITTVTIFSDYTNTICNVVRKVY